MHACACCSPAVWTHSHTKSVERASDSRRRPRYCQEPPMLHAHVPWTQAACAGSMLCPNPGRHALGDTKQWQTQGDKEKCVVPVKRAKVKQTDPSVYITNEQIESCMALFRCRTTHQPLSLRATQILVFSHDQKL